MTKIIPLKRLNKPDYTNPNIFCLIDFFSTVNKAIKVVIAEKMSYLVERHSFLPFNYYGVLKQKSPTDVLLTV